MWVIKFCTAIASVVLVEIKSSLSGHIPLKIKVFRFLKVLNIGTMLDKMNNTDYSGPLGMLAQNLSRNSLHQLVNSSIKLIFLLNSV